MTRAVPSLLICRVPGNREVLCASGSHRVFPSALLRREESQGAILTACPQNRAPSLTRLPPERAPSLTRLLPQQGTQPHPPAPTAGHPASLASLQKGHPASPACLQNQIHDVPPEPSNPCPDSRKRMAFLSGAWGEAQPPPASGSPGVCVLTYGLRVTQLPSTTPQAAFRATGRSSAHVPEGLSTSSRPGGFVPG